MENKKFTDLIDKLNKQEDVKLLDVYSEICTILESDKTGDSEYSNEYGETLNYAFKRAIAGSTDDNRIVQRNFTLFGQLLMNIPTNLNIEKVVNEIEKNCSQTNVIKKGEKFYFKYSLLRNLFSVLYSRTFLKDKLFWRALLEKILEIVKKDSQCQMFFCLFLCEYTDYFTNKSKNLDEALTKNVCQFLKDLIMEASKIEDQLKKEKQNPQLHQLVYEYHQALAYCIDLIAPHLDKSTKEELTNGTTHVIDSCKTSIAPKMILSCLNNISGEETLGSMKNIQVYDLICAFVAKSPEKRLPKLTKAVGKFLESIKKDNLLRHRKSIQIISLLRSVFSQLSLSFINGIFKEVLKGSVAKNEMDVEEQNLGKQDSNDVIKYWLQYWLKQFGSKNEDSKNNAILLQKDLTENLSKNLTDEDEKSDEEILKFTVNLLKFVKSKPTNPLRGKKMVLMNFLLNKLYQNEEAWNKYYFYLQQKLENSETVSSVNFYLNEIEAQSQAGQFESNKSAKEIKAKAKGTLDRKTQDKLRFNATKYLLNIYGMAYNWKSLVPDFQVNAGIKEDIKNNDEVSFKTFQKGIYERIINILFKSIKFMYFNTKKVAQTNEITNSKNGSRKHSGNSNHKTNGVENADDEDDIFSNKKNLLKMGLNKYYKIILKIKESGKVSDAEDKIDTQLKLLLQIKQFNKEKLEPKLMILLDMVGAVLLVNIYEEDFDDSFSAAEDLISVIKKLEFNENDKPKKKLKKSSGENGKIFLVNKIRVESL